jgi:hypothetical protein
MALEAVCASIDICCTVAFQGLLLLSLVPRLLTFTRRWQPAGRQDPGQRQQHLWPWQSMEVLDMSSLPQMQASWEEAEFVDVVTSSPPDFAGVPAAQQDDPRLTSSANRPCIPY